MFEGQPKGLFALALANTGERFGYYTMLAVFALFLRANYGLDAGWAGEIYSDFLMLVYFLPIVGGWLPSVSLSCLLVICYCQSLLVATHLHL